MLLLLSRFSRVRLLATPWTAAHQAPPSMGFARQEHSSGGAIAFSKEVYITMLFQYVINKRRMIYYFRT